MAKQVKCSIVSGAPHDCSAFLQQHIDRDSFIIAADAGYVPLLQAGITPDVIVGDFDSAPVPQTDCRVITFPKEKDYTDTFNCVRYAVKEGYREIFLYNALGSRFDHSYGNVLCLDYCRRHGVFCQLIDAHNRLTLIEKTYAFSKEYDYFSLFAFLEDCKGVRIDGARYTAGWYGKDSLDIKTGEQPALCNEVTAEACIITVEQGTLLLAESND